MKHNSDLVTQVRTRYVAIKELTYCHSKDDGRPDDPTDLDHLLRDWMHLQSGSTDGDLAGHKFPE
ncbi:uncharacterized protein LOC143027106 isoform X3 [Oratosquilla oratoria]|uniref:uncharacterized protein LOC143027106 isoform X3 n=1 Tax=Oratosquilla oratoria TaxID=337810 RepID=UPI003F771ACE